jgi:hypothetical protein
VENRRVFPVENHYLVEIDKVSTVGTIGTRTETFSWDIYIASNKREEYRGRATCSHKKHLNISWTNLMIDKKTPLDEMIEICERLMEQ